MRTKSRQGPRISIRIDIWILPSDTETSAATPYSWIERRQCYLIISAEVIQTGVAKTASQTVIIVIISFTLSAKQKKKKKKKSAKIIRTVLYYCTTTDTPALLPTPTQDLICLPLDGDGYLKI